MKYLIACILFVYSFNINAQTNLVFDETERTDGSAFFAMDQYTGQVYYMLDYGSSGGEWKSYGGVIEGNKGGLAFVVTERTDGSAFFAMDKTNGQVYFMLDYGTNAGKWKTFGSTFGGDLANAEFRFSVAERKSGTAFFAMNAQTGQVYYMLDYGNESGKWRAYGGKVGN